MSNLSNANTASSTQITEKQIRGFLKVFAFYVTLFTFWVWLFITNEGPGGVEFQHLIMMGIVQIGRAHV